MENVKITFLTIPEGKKPPNGFQHVNCHMVFNIKMEDFHRKVSLVAGGQMTHTPDTVTYSSVVTRETVCNTLTMAVLHDLEVKAADVMNTYVIAPNTGKIRTVVGVKFEDNTGKSARIVRALYGLRSAGTSFKAHLAQCRQELGYQSCNVDLDL